MSNFIKAVVDDLENDLSIPTEIVGKVYRALKKAAQLNADATMTDMREAERERIGRLANEICGCSTLEQHRRDIALIEAEIDRRVAEEKAALLERLREPSEAMVSAGYLSIYDTSGDTKPEEVWQAMLAQFEKGQADG